MTLEESLIARGFSVLEPDLNDFQIEREFGSLGSIFVGGRHGDKWIGIDQGIDQSVVLLYGQGLSDDAIIACADILVDCLKKIEKLTWATRNETKKRIS